MYLTYYTNPNDEAELLMNYNLAELKTQRDYLKNDKARMDEKVESYIAKVEEQIKLVEATEMEYDIRMSRSVVRHSHGKNIVTYRVRTYKKPKVLPTVNGHELQLEMTDYKEFGGRFKAQAREYASILAMRYRCEVRYFG